MDTLCRCYTGSIATRLDMLTILNDQEINQPLGILYTQPFLVRQM